MALKRKTVFLVHKFETSDGKKHNVHFGRNLNNPKNTKRFTKLSVAKKFALNKARKMGVKSVLMDLPSGTKDVLVKVPMVNKKSKRVRRTARRTSPFDLGF